MLGSDLFRLAGDVRRDSQSSPFAPAKGVSFAGAKDDNKLRPRGEAVGSKSRCGPTHSSWEWKL